MPEILAPLSLSFNMWVHIQFLKDSQLDLWKVQEMDPSTHWLGKLGVSRISNLHPGHPGAHVSCGTGSCDRHWRDGRVFRVLAATVLLRTELSISLQKAQWGSLPVSLDFAYQLTCGHCRRKYFNFIGWVPCASRVSDKGIDVMLSSYSW